MGMIADTTISAIMTCHTEVMHVVMVACYLSACLCAPLCVYDFGTIIVTLYIYLARYFLVDTSA